MEQARDEDGADEVEDEAGRGLQREDAGGEPEEEAG